ncbi:hypothetical protein [Carp edema virus]|nr:hypothetical protein [Carp edema virus]
MKTNYIKILVLLYTFIESQHAWFKPKPGSGYVCDNCPCQFCDPKYLSGYDKLQAEAYNAVRNNKRHGKPWQEYDVMDFMDKLGFGFAYSTYGSKKETCHKCKVNYWNWWMTECYDEGCTSKYCLPYNRDGWNRPCQKTPEWDDYYYGMWCRTWHSWRISNWGYTHFPICKHTKTICMPTNDY